jgi:hypothetical protein
MNGLPCQYEAIGSKHAWEGCDSIDTPGLNERKSRGYRSWRSNTYSKVTNVKCRHSTILAEKVDGDDRLNRKVKVAYRHTIDNPCARTDLHGFRSKWMQRALYSHKHRDQVSRKWMNLLFLSKRTRGKRLLPKLYYKLSNLQTLYAETLRKVGSHCKDCVVLALKATERNLFTWMIVHCLDLLGFTLL